MTESQHEVSLTKRLAIEAFFKGRGGLWTFEPAEEGEDPSSAQLSYYSSAEDESLDDVVREINENWLEEHHVTAEDVIAVAKALTDEDEHLG